MTLHAPLCSIGDIEAIYDFKFDSVSTPSSTSVNEWIKNATAMCYSAIGNIYDAPIEDESDLLVLKEICSLYVQSKVGHVKSAFTYTVPGTGAVLPRTMKIDNFIGALKLISDGVFKLNTTMKSSNTFALDYNSVNAIEAVADKGSIQW